MKLKQADIFFDLDELDYICITTNSIVKKNGELVMGAGIAKTAKDMFPKLPKLFGSQILNKNCYGDFYGCLLADEKFIAFQTKLHYKDKSPINVVVRSINILNKLANKYQNKRFGLPFPAINNGGLLVEDVLPHLLKLPDNVIVYHLEDIKNEIHKV